MLGTSMAALEAEYKKGFNAYVKEQKGKDKLIRPYSVPGAVPDLPPLDQTNAIATPDMMPNVPLEPPGMPMGDSIGGMPMGGGMGGMGSMPMGGGMDSMPNLPMMPGAPTLSLIQRQNPDGDSADELIRKNDEALRKHFGSPKQSLNRRPATTLVQGEGSGLSAEDSAEFVMQKAAYQQWFQKNQEYQKQYAINTKSSFDIAESMRNKLELSGNLEEQQRALGAEILDAMHASSAHKGKSASMIRVNSTLNSAAKQQHRAEVEAREKVLWSEWHHLQQVQRELAQDQKDYEKTRLKTVEQQQLGDSRWRQKKTLWTNFETRKPGTPGFFLAPA